MSIIKLIDVHPTDPSSQSKMRGHALVEVDGKMQIYMVIIAAKDNYLLKFPSVMVPNPNDLTQKQFFPAISFHSDLENRISQTIAPQLLNHPLLA